jgi:acyl-coenzyme A thioesterase PaaI-like protein
MDSLQDEYAPNSTCFGCGPKNLKGLRIKSRPEGVFVVSDWSPEDHHAAFAGFVSGGILSTLLDCHCNWTGAYELMRRGGLASPPATVTAGYAVSFLRPTPLAPLRMKARAVAVDRGRVTVEGEIVSGGMTTATFKGTFVAVKEGHPAFQRWK